MKSREQGEGKRTGAKRALRLVAVILSYAVSVESSVELSVELSVEC